MDRKSQFWLHLLQRVRRRHLWLWRSRVMLQEQVDELRFCRAEEGRKSREVPLVSRAKGQRQACGGSEGSDESQGKRPDGLALLTFALAGHAATQASFEVWTDLYLRDRAAGDRRKSAREFDLTAAGVALFEVLFDIQCALGRQLMIHERLEVRTNVATAHE
jgi:hypothetical protein